MTQKKPRLSVTSPKHHPTVIPSHRGMLFSRSMAHRIALPRICIALGFPEVETSARTGAQRVRRRGTLLRVSARIIWHRPNRASLPCASFCRAIPTAPSWPPAAATRTTDATTAAWRNRSESWMPRSKAGAKAVDIEIESAENCVDRLDALRTRAYLLLSYHNYGGTPALESVLQADDAHFGRRLQDCDHGSQTL